MAHSQPNPAPVPADMEQLLQHYDGYISGCIRRMSRYRLSDETLEDLKQDVLLRIFEKKLLDSYDAQRSSFTTYLFYVIRSVTLNHIDKYKHDPLNSPAALTQEDVRLRAAAREQTAAMKYQMIDATFENREVAHIFADEVDRDLAALSNPGPRRAFSLMRQGKTNREVAQEMHVSPTCVSVYAKRIREQVARFTGLALAVGVYEIYIDTVLSSVEIFV